MKVFVSLAVALVAAVALSPAAALDAKAIAPRRQPEPLTAVEGLAHSHRRLEEVLSTENEATTEEVLSTENEAAPEEVGAEGDDDEVLTAEATEVPTVDGEADAEAKPVEEDVAPLIEPVSFKADSTSGSTETDADADEADAGRENEVDEETSAPADERRRNLRSL